MSSIFSGSATRRAAVETAGYLQNAGRKAAGLMDLGYRRADGRLTENYRLYDRAYTNGMGSLSTGYKAGRGQIQKGIDAWQNVYDDAQAGATAYGDATGANGAEGYGRAVNNFHTGPGYQFNMDEMLDAVNRSAATRGMLASGNTTADLMTKASGIANQEFGNYVARLQPYLQMYTQGAQGLSGAHGAMADLEVGYGKDRAGMEQWRAGGKADTNTARAGLVSDYGNNRANVLLDIAGQIGGLRMTAAQAGQQAAANRFGAIMGGVNTALNLGTKLMGMA